MCTPRFMDWRLRNKEKSLSENVMLAYYDELSIQMRGYFRPHKYNLNIDFEECQRQHKNKYSDTESDLESESEIKQIDEILLINRPPPYVFDASIINPTCSPTTSNGVHKNSNGDFKVPSKVTDQNKILQLISPKNKKRIKKRKQVLKACSGVEDLLTIETRLVVSDTSSCPRIVSTAVDSSGVEINLESTSDVINGDQYAFKQNLSHNLLTEYASKAVLCDKMYQQEAAQLFKPSASFEKNIITNDSHDTHQRLSNHFPRMRTKPDEFERPHKSSSNYDVTNIVDRFIRASLTEEQNNLLPSNSDTGSWSGTSWTTVVKKPKVIEKVVESKKPINCDNHRYQKLVSTILTKDSKKLAARISTGSKMEAKQYNKLQNNIAGNQIESLSSMDIYQDPTHKAEFVAVKNKKRSGKRNSESPKGTKNSNGNKFLCLLNLEDDMSDTNEQNDIASLESSDNDSTDSNINEDADVASGATSYSLNGVFKAPDIIKGGPKKVLKAAATIGSVGLLANKSIAAIKGGLEENNLLTSNIQKRVESKTASTRSNKKIEIDSVNSGNNLKNVKHNLDGGTSDDNLCDDDDDIDIYDNLMKGDGSNTLYYDRSYSNVYSTSCRYMPHESMMSNGLYYELMNKNLIKMCDQVLSMEPHLDQTTNIVTLNQSSNRRKYFFTGLDL